MSLSMWGTLVPGWFGGVCCTVGTSVSGIYPGECASGGGLEV